MPLPESLNQAALESASCDLDCEREDLLEKLADPMEEYIEEVVEKLRERFGLGEDSYAELFDRVQWKLVLMPSTE